MSDIHGTQRPARKRRRPAVVCAECRRRKIACDRKTPCGQCALHNVECVYVTGSVPPPYGRPLRTPVSPGSQPGLAVPGERNDLATGNVSGTGTAAATAAASAGVGAAGALGAGAGTGTGTGSAAADGPNGPTATTSPLDEEDEVLPSAELTNTMVSLGERSSRFGGRLAKTRLFGRTHWMNNMDEFKDIHSLTHLVHFVTGSVIYKSMRTCKRIARVIKAEELARIAAPLEDGEPLWLTVPPRAVADRLVELYFNVFEPQFRILHMPTFRREYEAFMDEQDQSQSQPVSPSSRDPEASRRDPPTHTSPKTGQGGASADFMIKLVLVLSMGSCFYDGDRDEIETEGSPDNTDNTDSTGSPRTTAAAAAAALHDRLRIAAARAVQRMDVAHCAPLDKHRLNLDTLQTYCLVTLARQTTALDLADDLTWFTTGGLLHTAFGMGLNRDPSHFKSLSFAQSEMRRRLWATILELVVQASLDQGMPPLISTDDYDCAPPLNLDDDAFGVGSDSASLEGNVYDHITVDLPMHGVSMPGQGNGHGGSKKRKGGPGPRVPGGAGGNDGLGAGNIGSGQSLLPRGEHSFRRPAAPRKGHPDTVFTHTSMQRLLCRSLPVRLKITKALNGLGAGLTYERALQLSADLLETCRYTATTLRAAPLMWRPATGDVGEASTDKEKAALEKERAAFAKLRIAFYEILTRRFHHSLHSPFARKAGNNVQFFYSRRARIETVLRLLSFFRRPTTHAAMLADFNTPIASDESTATERESGIPLTLLQPTAAEDPCRRLWLVGRGMLKCTMVDIKATAVIEMIHQLQEDYVPGSDLTLSQRELYDTVRTIIELSHARIEAGETNVKGYLFFRGALAQVDALMQGKPVRQVIIEAAQSSSTKTINTLKNLAARRGVALPDDLGGTNLGDDLDPPSISPVALQTDELRATAGTTSAAAPAAAATTVAPALTTNGNGNGNNNGNNIYTAKLNNVSNNVASNIGSLSNTAFAAFASPNASTSGPSPSQILGMTEMGTVTFSDLERGASGTGLNTHMVDGSGGGGGDVDVDSGIHLPSANLSSNGGGSHTDTNVSQGGPWVDEWLMMDPPGDFGLGNWFFPYNDRINNS